MLSNGKIIEYVPRLDELRSYIKTKYEGKKWYLSDDDFKRYDNQKEPIVEDIVQKPVIKEIKQKEPEKVASVFELNKSFSKTSLYEQKESVDRTELKKSILALYSKPKDSAESIKKSVSLEGNDLFKDLI